MPNQILVIPNFSTTTTITTTTTTTNNNNNSKSLCWDVTVTCRLVKSYFSRSAYEAGAAAEVAASRKEEK